jgi:hypothetical protein
VNRMTRGFHRLGLAFALPLAVIAVWGMGSAFLGFDETGTGAFIGFCAGVLAIAWYTLCRLVAWVVNGFREASPVVTDHD